MLGMRRREALSAALPFAVALLCSWQCAAFAQAGGTGGPLGLFHSGQDTVNVAAGVRVADFSTLPANLNDGEVIAIPETQLNGEVPISSVRNGNELPGTHPLGPAEVQSLARVISTELAPVPASQAPVNPIIEFPEVALRGESVLDTLSTQQPLRIPTVFAPFYAGTVFTVAGREAPPGTTLNMSNMTLLLPNVTYDGIFESGFMDFFDLGTSARVCFTNSILALESCEGYLQDTFHMWCCTKRQCNILYTQLALEDLGYDTHGNLDFIPCVEVGGEPDSAAAPAEGAGDGEAAVEPQPAPTAVRVADFEGLTADLASNTDAEVDFFAVPEVTLTAQVAIGAGAGASTLYGAHALGPDEVIELAEAVSTTLVPIPASAAARTLPIKFLTPPLRGQSVESPADGSAAQPLRIPTVFAPFYAGAVFTVEGREAPPGTTLTFSNMTLLLPNVTHDGIFESGFMDFFDLGRSARVCFTNSILALRSCEGFIPNVYHMWCCTKRQCNILYTQQALEDLGFDTRGGLDPMQCYSTTPELAPETAGTTATASDTDGVAAVAPLSVEASTAAPGRRAAAAVHAVLWGCAVLGVLGFAR